MLAGSALRVLDGLCDPLPNKCWLEAAATVLNITGLPTALPTIALPTIALPTIILLPIHDARSIPKVPIAPRLDGHRNLGEGMPWDGHGLGHRGRIAGRNP